MRFLVSSICVLLICQLTFVRAGSSMDSSLADNMTITLTPACDVTCTNFNTINDNCNSPHCGCNTEYIEAQGNCLLCFSTTPEDDAAVQFLLDSEAAQCQREGHSVSFSLDLPPLAEALVQTFNRQSADLRRNQVVFLTLQILGGHIGLPVILIFSLYSCQVRRDSTFLNFCVTWIFSSIAFSLLLYRGTTGNTILNTLGEIEPDICIAQAVLTTGAQMMTACSTLSLNIRLWLGLRALVHGDEVCFLTRETVRRWTTAGLLVTPYMFFVIFSLCLLFVGTTRIEGSSLQGAVPSYFTCTTTAAKPLAGVIYGIALVLVLASVGFDVHIISILYRHWWSCWHTRTKSAVSPLFLIRVVFFSIFQIIVAATDGTVIGILPKTFPKIDSLPIVGTVLVMESTPQWINMLEAATPLVAALIFGITNNTIMMVTNFIIFWRRNVSANDEGLEVISISKDGCTNTMAPTEFGDSSARESIIVVVTEDHENGIHKI